MRTRLLFFFSVALATGAALPAQPQLVSPLLPPQPPPAPRGCPSMAPAQPPTEAEQQARAYRRPQLDGRGLARAVRTVTRELEWHRELEDAATAAQERQKPIVWIQLLGDLRGRT